MQGEGMKKKVIFGFFWRFSERIVAQSISLIVSIVLARLLLPEDYGAVALVMVFITIADVFVNNGLGNALIQKMDADDIDFSSVFYINIIIGIVLYLVLFLIAPLVAEFYHMPVLQPGLRVLAIRIPIASINSVQQAYVSRNMLFKRFFWSTLFGTMISGVVGIILAYHGAGVWALIAQYLTNTCIDTIVLWITVRWRPKLICSWKRAKKLISYGWKLLVSGLLDTGYRQLRTMIIGKLYTSSDLAYYNQGDKYPNLIVSNVNTAIGSVLFPAMSQYQNDREKVKQMTRRVIQVSSYVMWPLMIGLGVIAEPMVSVILTDKWLNCVPYLRIFCFTYGLWPIHTANLQAVNAMGRSDLFLKLEIMKKGIGLIALLISMRISPLAMAASLIVTDIIATFINTSPNLELLKYGYFEQLKDLLPSFAMAMGMAVIVYPISFLKISDIYIMILQIVTGGLIYLLESIIFRNPAFLYFKETIKNRT